MWNQKPKDIVKDCLDMPLSNPRLKQEVLNSLRVMSGQQFHFLEVVGRSNTESHRSRLKLKVIAPYILSFFLLEQYQT